MSNILSEEIAIQIRRIKQISFFIDERLSNDLEPISDVNMEYRSEYNLEKDFLFFTLKISYSIPKLKKVFLQTEIQNVFEIRDLKNYLDEEKKLSLPPKALILICSLSFSHSRAIMSLNVAGTAYNDNMLPIMDGKDIAARFFGEKFLKDWEKEKNEMITDKSKDSTPSVLNENT